MSKENQSDVLVVLQKLAETERGDFETAVPDIATILKLVEIEKIARENRIEAEKNKRWVGLKCPECGTTRTHLYAPNEVPARCNGIPKNRKTDYREGEGYPVCGAVMKVMYDQANDKNDEALTKWQEPSWVTRSGAR